MRVALVAEVGSSGGTRTYCRMLVEMLARQGADVRALVTFPRDDTVFRQSMEDLGVSVTRLPDRKKCWQLPIFATIWEFFRLCLFLLRHRPDVIIASTGSPGWWFGALLFPVPAIIVVHSVVAPLGRKVRFVWPRLLKRLSVMRRLVTVSQYAVDKIAQHWGVRASCIHNPTPSPTAAIVEHSHFGKTVLTAGHVVDYKNPEAWFEVAKATLARQPDARFVWFGDGPLLEQMRAKASSDSRITFAGLSTSLGCEYERACVYFQPSLLESHGIAVVEAMSYALPCVTTTVGGLTESVLHGVSGYSLPAEQTELMVEKICELLESPQKAHEMGEAGRRRVLEKFMPDVWEQQFMALLHECIEDQNRQK